MHISERGWWGSSRRFSHRRSVLADMNAPRNPLRNHAPTVTGKFEGKIGSYLKYSFFGFLLAPKVAVTKLAKSGLAIFANFSRFNNFPRLFGCLTTLLLLGTARNYQTV